MTPKDVVLSFWDAMGTNDFEAASQCLSPNFEGYWPQSHGLTKGRRNFAKINTVYPSQGEWRFHLNTIVSEHELVVTDVTVTDGSTTGRAITFHTVENGLITKQTEFWPDPFDAPEWRKRLVSIVEDEPNR